MPAKDRRPRRRLKAVETDSADLHELEALARVATPADWDAGLRRRYVRALVAKGLTPEIATGIATAFERRPELIPRPPPRGVVTI